MSSGTLNSTIPYHTYSNYVVSEIFNGVKCRDLEIRVSGHSRSLKVVPFDWLPMVSY